MIVDKISYAPRCLCNHPGIDAALRWIEAEGVDKLLEIAEGRHDNLTVHPGTFGIMQRYETRGPEKVVWEAHRKHIDVQVMLKGVERVGWRALSEALPVKSEFEEARDAAFYDLPDDGSGFEFEAGQFAVFWPSDVHAPSLRIHSDTANGSTVTKLVIKVPVA